MSPSRPKVAFCIFLIAGVSAAVAWAQEAAAPDGDAVRVFLDCPRWVCDFDYLRSEIQFVDYVRIRQAADVQVLVTTQETGGGGEEYTLTFIGQDAFEGLRNTLTYTAPGVFTEAEVRSGLARVLKSGLLPYISQTRLFDQIQITYDAAAGEPVATAPADDPWNFWIFEVGIDGYMQGEQRTSSYSFSGELSANRTTEAWKIDLEAEARRSRSEFQINDTTIADEQRSYEFDGLVVRSLTPHWSAGATVSAGSSTFSNYDLAVRVKAAVEYSLFPYDVATRRQLTALYEIGVNSFDYDEVTIFARSAETRMHQELSVRLDLEQPWGSVSMAVSGSNYFFDLSRNRLGFRSNIDLQLFRGLSLDLRGGISRVRDQLSISAADLTEEDILLRRRELATNYEYFFSMGISYTFGSIYNSVVNPRFDG